jgi:DNA-binding CsgD family transcriptional regulator
VPFNRQHPDESTPDDPPLTARERALLEEIRSGEAAAKLARAAAEDVTGVKPVPGPHRER